MKTIIKIAFIVAIALMHGCTTQNELTIESTKPWEGHYFTTEELNRNINSIQLEKDESIWIITNHTLNRLLKEISNK